jgi:hypothetical protein
MIGGLVQDRDPSEFAALEAYAPWAGRATALASTTTLTVVKVRESYLQGLALRHNDAMTVHESPCLRS